jgi:hypothetical protein
MLLVGGRRELVSQGGDYAVGEAVFGPVSEQDGLACGVFDAGVVFSFAVYLGKVRHGKMFYFYFIFFDECFGGVMISVLIRWVACMSVEAEDT